VIIDCISDLHGCKPALQGGDLLIVAGDLTGRDTMPEYLKFNEWLSDQDYKRKIVIAGNHDGLIEKGVDVLVGKGKNMLCNPLLAHLSVYLQDSGTTFEGLKIWGSPWTPTFLNWHFMKDRGDPIKEKWDLIPDDTDILITHGPPYCILDKVEVSSKGDKYKRAGCMDLMNRIPQLKNLKLHVFGHIHGSCGMESIRGVTFVNASIMDEDYNPVNKPVRIIL